MLNRLILLFSLAALIILMVMINLTTPAEAGPPGVLVFFTAVYGVVFGIITGIVFLFRKTMGKSNLRRKDYCYVAVMSFGPIMMLLMQAFGSLSIATIGLTVVFIGLGCFLVNKRL